MRDTRYSAVRIRLCPLCLRENEWHERAPHSDCGCGALLGVQIIGGDSWCWVPIVHQNIKGHEPYAQLNLFEEGIYATRKILRAV